MFPKIVVPTNIGIIIKTLLADLSIDDYLLGTNDSPLPDVYEIDSTLGFEMVGTQTNFWDWAASNDADWAS